MRRPLAALVLGTAMPLVLLQPPAALAQQVVVVQAGETLSEIADRHGVSLTRLMQANGISNPDHVEVGQRLTLPGSASRGSSASSQRGGTVTVRAGETLSEIAERHGVSLSRLMQTNGISNPDHVEMGQRLTLPGGAARAGASPARNSQPTAPYTVKSGETLSDIAARFNTTTDRLIQLNGLRDPDLVMSGTRLQVPAQPRAAAPAKPAAAPVNRQATEHVVSRGESLSLIAERYGTSVDRLVALNQLEDPERLLVGTRLKLRGTPPAPQQARRPAAPTTTAPAPAPAAAAAPKPTQPAATSAATASPRPTAAPATASASAPAASSAATAAAAPATTAVTTPRPAATTANTATTTATATGTPSSAGTTSRSAASSSNTSSSAASGSATRLTASTSSAANPGSSTSSPSRISQATSAASQSPSRTAATATTATAATATAAATASATTTASTGGTAARATTAATSSRLGRPASPVSTAPGSRSTVAATTASPASAASTTANPAAARKPASGDWRNYGPLQVDWSKLQPMGGSYVAPSLNGEGQPLYLAVNCTARKINVTSQAGQWKTWETPSKDFEQKLVQDICKARAS